MDVIELYHGSGCAVPEPCIERCRPHNDYGQGFYCTPSLDMAKEWACQKGSDGFASCYRLELEGLIVVDLNGDGYSILHWLEVLLQNRFVRMATPTMQRGAAWLQENFAVDLTHADVVCGYRADDSYFGFARAFMRNEITLDQVSQAMRLGELGIQYMMKSRRAFAALEYVGCQSADASVYWPRQMQREEDARAAFANMVIEAAVTKDAPGSDGVFISDLMRMSKEELDDCLRR